MRELSDVDVRLQAEALANYVVRGGSASRWLEVKEFLPDDRTAILTAYGDLMDEQETA